MSLGVNAGIRLILSLSKDEAFTGRDATSSFDRLRMRPNSMCLLPELQFVG